MMRACLSRRRTVVCCCLVLACTALHELSVCAQQQQPAPLPSNWQSLAPAAFVSAVAPFYDLDARTLFFHTINDSAVRAQAAALIANIDYSGNQYDLPTLNTIHLLANPLLLPTDQARIRKGVLARQDNWSGQPYSMFDAKLDLMSRLHIPPAAAVQDGSRWAQAGAQLSAVPPQSLTDAYLYFASTAPQGINGSFAVHWQGQVTAPQTGAYTFSISPINLNSPGGGGQYPLQVAMTVNVGGNVVLSANASQWTRSSTQINLTAGQPIALAVDWSAQVLTALPAGAFHALLSWQGPGINASIVPQSALLLPDGSAPGLQATYSWTNWNGQQQTFTRMEPNIDVAWTSPPVWLLPPDTSALAQAGALYLQNVTASTFVAGFTGLKPPVELHQLYPVFWDPDGSGQLLNSAQRATILSLVQSQPSLLDPVDPIHFAKFYRSYWIGNTDAALAVFGTWATRHADIACVLPTGAPFEQDARNGYRRLALYVTQQLPEQAAQLQSQFLVTPDGRCCLPVAYTLAYSYLAQNNLAAWTSFLDNRLSDSTLTGDLRVNWLLARALAEEIRQAKPPVWLDVNVYTRPTDGMIYVTQASQAAQSAWVQLRAALEQAGRLASAGQLSAATGVLQPLANSMPAAQQAVLASWTTDIAVVTASQATAAANQAAATQQAYLNTLAQRLNQAAANGNTALANYYNALIGGAQSTPTPPSSP
jgi:PA14 domain